jgi:hypothetical protein
MGLEQHITSPENNQRLAERIAELQEKKTLLEQQLREGDKTLEGQELTSQQIAVKNRIASETLFEIAKVQQELGELEKKLTQAMGSALGNLNNLAKDTSYTAFEKQYQNLPVQQIEMKKKELEGALNNLLKKTEGDASLQLLSSEFGGDVELNFQIEDTRKKIDVLERLIIRAKKYDVEENPWRDISGRDARKDPGQSHEGTGFRS